uniref:NLE domain-containing protein n=1 Tax=Rhodosorus marinus TaxID=101924 RepID=A0A7S3EIH8_9RHOD|mmetsp:Transcript_36544/g.146083  ORF Transcript_36544/g.146083 Transcript_36544/m.146083 type:complete len:419 (+) Transcript_36544:265-1521(+)|eukprot:CAMPEP_0113956704 /NCGR_PEP_ID=MMETSP0011_2-20120614/2234_1 /TAXON_ID=101924 /ORGANISM="Rhodosorus marinus" /LENGTH=418 /DNA_ID=CAMNT_0000966929 /DNA_START=112 /DNA_END=1368 /DNA_ORIENTATION=- /assembly_acc=CAM_ASM_000156
MDGNSEVRVRFTTRLEDEKLAVGSGVELVVPGSVKRKGLNEIMIQILGLEEDHRENFEFVVHGSLLRGELGKLCVQKGFSVEKTVEVEYSLRGKPVRAEEEAIDLDDWVCCVDSLKTDDGGCIFACGTYSGNLKIMEGSAVVSETRISERAVKSVSWTSRSRLVAAGADGFLRNFEVTKSFKLRQVLIGSCAGVEPFESTVSVGKDRIAGGTSTGSLVIFETSRESNELLSEIRNVKRPRSSYEDVIRAVPSRELEGHSLNVTSLAYDSDKLFSGAWDGMVIEWEAETAQRVRTIPTTMKAVTSVSVSSQLVAASCTDGALRILDFRSDSSTPVMSVRRAHRAVANSTKWRPDHEYEVASTGSDSAVRVWDIRANLGVTFKRTEAHGVDGRGLCLSWCGESKLASGGSDGVLRVFTLV